MARRLGNISRETIPLLILFVAQQKPSRGGLWHPILMQFYSGPLMQLLSGVDTAPLLSNRARLGENLSTSWSAGRRRDKTDGFDHIGDKQCRNPSFFCCPPPWPRRALSARRRIPCSPRGPSRAGPAPRKRPRAFRADRGCRGAR